MLYLRVNDCDVSDWIDLPELTSLQMDVDSFSFKYDDTSNTLIMRSDCLLEN